MFLFRSPVYSAGIFLNLHISDEASLTPAREADLCLRGHSLRNPRYKEQSVGRHSLGHIGRKEWAEQAVKLDSWVEEYLKVQLKKLAMIMEIFMWIPHYTCINWDLSSGFEVADLKSVINVSDKISQHVHPLPPPCPP